MNFPTEISPETQLILDEIRKLSAMQSELFADLAVSISRLAAPFAASVSPVPAPFIVADNWGGLFDGGHNSDELFEQPAHILVETAAIDAADSADISVDVFGSNQIRDGNGLTSIAEDALLDASEELVLQRPYASGSACLSPELESVLAYAGQLPIDAEATEYIYTSCSALITTAPVSSSMSDLTCITPVAPPPAATCVTAAPALSAAAVEGPDPRSALMGSGSVIIAFHLGPVKWALRTTPLSGYDATVDDDPAAGFVHFDAPLDRAVGRVGQVLVGAAALRADAVGAAGGGLLVRVVDARSAQTTCSTVCLADDCNLADILVGVLWEEGMLHWNDGNHRLLDARLVYEEMPSKDATTTHSVRFVSSLPFCGAANIGEGHRIFVEMFGPNPVVLELLLAENKLPRPPPVKLEMLSDGVQVQLRPTPWPSFTCLTTWCSICLVQECMMQLLYGAINRWFMIWGFSLLVQRSNSKFWGFPLFVGHCASGHKYMLDEKCDLSELCSQLMKKFGEHDIDKASWVVLDTDLKHEDNLGGRFGTVVIGFLQNNSSSQFPISCQVEVYVAISMDEVFWQPHLSFRHSQFALGLYAAAGLVRLKSGIDISFITVHIRPIPLPFFFGSAAPVHLKTSLSVPTMLVISNQLYFGFWSLVCLGCVLMQYKLPWPQPQSNRTWLHLSVSCMIRCSLRQSAAPFFPCVRCQDYWKLWLEFHQNAVQVAELNNIKLSCTWSSVYMIQLFPGKLQALTKIIRHLVNDKRHMLLLSVGQWGMILSLAYMLKREFLVEDEHLVVTVTSNMQPLFQFCPLAVAGIHADGVSATLMGTRIFQITIVRCFCHLLAWVALMDGQADFLVSYHVHTCWDRNSLSTIMYDKCLVVASFLSTNSIALKKRHGQQTCYAILHDAPTAEATEFLQLLSSMGFNISVLIQIRCLQFPWDPGGPVLLHRLGGKPKLKKGRMSATTHSWAVIWALGLGPVECCLDYDCTSATRAQEQQLGRASINQTIINRKVIFLLQIFAFSLLFIFSSGTLRFYCCLPPIPCSFL